MSLDMPNSASPGSPGSAGQMPGRPSIQSPTGGKISKNNEFQKVISKENSEHQEYANPPAGVRDANLAAARDDVTAPLTAASCSATVANPASLSWGDSEMADMDVNNGFTTVRTKKRRRVSPGSPAAAAPSSGTRGAGATRRPRSSTGWAPRAEEVRTTRAHIAEARARQASSTEDHCVYIERSPELEPYHYMRALDRMLGGTREVFQMTKMNGHFLVGLANRGLAERLVNEGLEVEGTLHRAFPFRKRAERITVGNLPFFVGDAAVISALSSFGRVTSIAPKLMKAGPYIYNDGRREAFIILREGMTIERLPTRLDITIKGEAWPAYLSSGIRCSRCRGQGHRRANCPLLARRTTAPGPATPTSPTSVPPATAPGLPQQPSAQPPPPASPSPTMEVSDVPPTRRAALHPPEALRQSPPAPSALPAEDAPPAPPPVTPAPSLRTPGSREPAAPTPDVEMSIVEETFASSTSSAKNATRVDLDAFIEGLPSVSFAKTDALGLGREEVLDLLSSRTKAQRKGPLLSPPQCDALVGLIGQILDLKPGHTSNLYKVLGQVKAELRTTPAVPPTPTLPAPRPDGPIPPPPHGDTTTPDMATSPSPLSTQMDRALMDKRWEALRDLMHQLDLEFELDLEHRFESRVDEDDIIRAILYPGDREPLIKRLPTRDRYTLGGLMSTAIRRARELDPSILEYLPSVNLPEFGDIHLLLYADDIAIIGWLTWLLAGLVLRVSLTQVPSVVTPQGQISGSYTMMNGVKIESYLGIPFAKAPIENLRFQKPVPIENMAFVRRNITRPEMSEDCLRLNIWKRTDNGSNRTNIPVMVFIYGGGFVVGFVDTFLYEGDILAKEGDVILVTVNYRVGSLGFFSGNTKEEPGNLGLYDQLLAMQWIQKNIASFGGDPQQVTIFGESAGAASVSFHMISPLSGGLFQRAILESGSSKAPVLNMDVTKSLAIGALFSLRLGCIIPEISFPFFRLSFDLKNESNFYMPRLLKCLRSKTFQQIINAESWLLNTIGIGFFPIIGETFLPMENVINQKAQHTKDIEVIIGTNKNEGIFLMEFLFPSFDFVNKDNLMIKSETQNFIDVFAALVSGGIESTRKYSEPYFKGIEEWDVLGYFAERHASLNPSIFQYWYDHNSSVPQASYWPSTTHFSELPFVFGVPFRNILPYSEVDKNFSLEIMKIWTDFAHGRHPAEWPAYSPDKGRYVRRLGAEFGPRIDVTIPRVERCFNLWSSYFDAMYNLVLPLSFHLKRQIKFLYAKIVKMSEKHNFLT
ncbi:BCHE [Cordylochernes scorpioides]|uniref:BCHE n=1 Tax=Cordylochernes scorpioides TaxID=51811 RepID=A0ABY6KCC0_9ARAC|nr:BCHE [Cordylochernes scorpioides]